MVLDDPRPIPDARQPSPTRSSVFSLDEFAALVSAALDINSDRFPDGKLALTLSPESSSSCPFLSNNKDYCTHTCTPSSTLGATPARPLQFHPRDQQPPLPQQMHPPLGSIDLRGVSCVSGLNCAPSNSSSSLNKFGSVPTITLTTPSPTSRPRLVFNKIKKGASAFVARTRTLSSPVKHVPSRNPSRTALPPLPNQLLLNPKNPNYQPISTVSIAASFKNNIQLRSAVSLLDLEHFNNNSAFSLATNTADFYDDESDFVPYLPLACQYERAFPKSPSMPSLHPVSKPAAASAIGAATPLAKSSSKTGMGDPPIPPIPVGKPPTRNRCISSGHIQQRNARPDTRRRTLSAATASSAASTSDTGSPVTPRSAAFLKIVHVVRGDRNQEADRDRTSFLSLESGESEEGVNELLKGGPERGFDDDDDPFAKGSVQIVRSKSRAKPMFQLYNPNLVIGPGSAGEPVIVSNILREKPSKPSSNTSTSTSSTHDLHLQHSIMSDSTSTSASVVQPKPRPSRSPNSKGRKRPLRPSVSLIPISRMKKTPVVFPLMPGETEEGRRREEESKAKQGSEEEWTLCLGRRDVPGSGQSESEIERGPEDENEGGEGCKKNEEHNLEDKDKNTQGEKTKVDKTPVVGRERGRGSVKRKSVPQLRITQFVESGVDYASDGTGYVTAEDWTLMLPLYNVPKDPLLAQSERRGRNASHSPGGATRRREIGDEERRRAASFTDITKTTIAINNSFQSIPRSSSAAIRPSIDQITLLGTGPGVYKSPSPFEINPPTQQSAEKLIPPASNSNLSADLSGSGASYYSNGSAESRISVASVASRTTSSTATVVPGSWQKEHMQQRGECSYSSESRRPESGEERLNHQGDGERRLSTYSVRTMSSMHSSTREPSPARSLRKSNVVGGTPLSVGRELEVRTRAVSMGGYKRDVRAGTVDVSAGRAIGITSGWAIGSPASLYSPLSREGRRERERDKGKGKERSQEQEKEKEREMKEVERTGTQDRETGKNRESLMSMPGQWLTVSGREGSIRSVGSNESGESRRRMARGENGSVGSFDDGASGCSGAYYSARSSFSMVT